MAVWKALYAMVWLVFLEIIVLSLPWIPEALVGVHAVLGLAVLGLAFYNSSKLKKANAPARLVRIAKTTLGFAVFQAILGGVLAVPLSGIVAGSAGAVRFLHLVVALAVLAQAASVATAFDMWEEREFTSR